jgi:hypothetical protein
MPLASETAVRLQVCQLAESAQLAAACERSCAKTQPYPSFSRAADREIDVPSPSCLAMSDFKGRRFPTDIILICVRWYCKYGISYRDLEEMMSERSVIVDHTTLF